MNPVRARTLGLPLPGNTGKHNSITDVQGVLVGTTTVVNGAACTGVTAILPRGHEGVGVPCHAGKYVLNGNGEMTGAAWLEETGLLTLPISLTSTHEVGNVHRAIIDWTFDRHPILAEQWMLPVVTETWDGYLNDTSRRSIDKKHVWGALDSANGHELQEGSVGGGTGMQCYEYKGGNGTASRVVEVEGAFFTLGAFVQANFGERRNLTVCGVPVGRHLQQSDYGERGLDNIPPGAGSVVVILATDAPLLPNQCEAIARRVPFGLAKTGAFGSHYSGDFFLGKR